MNHEAVKQALLAAQHELTTLHNLTVTDNVESGITWTTNTSDALRLVDIALTGSTRSQSSNNASAHVFCIPAFSANSLNKQFFSKLFKSIDKLSK